MKQKEKEFTTIREYFYWAYANMSMAHVALKQSHEKYETLDYMIRAKLYKGLLENKMCISSLYDDEKSKLNNHVCCYCGSQHNLTLDHLIPRYAGGIDSGDNIIYACKSCNSSKMPCFCRFTLPCSPAAADFQNEFFPSDGVFNSRRTKRG